jgi:hypothetical protein
LYRQELNDSRKGASSVWPAIALVTFSDQPETLQSYTCEVDWLSRDLNAFHGGRMRNDKLMAPDIVAQRNGTHAMT